MRVGRQPNAETFKPTHNELMQDYKDNVYHKGIRWSDWYPGRVTVAYRDGIQLPNGERTGYDTINWER